MNNLTRKKSESPERPALAVITLGCKVNQYESEAIAEAAEARGFNVLSSDDINGNNDIDIFIINTCTVTAEADRKSRQMIRRARSHNKNAAVIVCGCFSQGSPDAALKLPGVAYVFGNTNKLASVDAALDIIKNGAPAIPVVRIGDDMQSVGKIEPMSVYSSPRTRAYIKICDGCDGKCSYCIIPHVRGAVRSKPRNEIISEVATLTHNGCREVVLTGIETASYGKDINDSLAGLLSAVAAIPGAPERIRLGSLEPTVVRDDFISVVTGNDNIMPHFHLSLQSGCTRTLNAMRRKYTAEGALSRIEALRKAIPDVMLSTDIIVGFPGETEEDFTQTLRYAECARFLHIHVFPYSPRRGTPAAEMKDSVPESVKHERSARLIAAGNKTASAIVRDYIAQNPVAEVLFESDSYGMHSGHTRNFIEVRTPLCGVRQGEIRRVCFTGADGAVAIGEVTE